MVKLRPVKRCCLSCTPVCVTKKKQEKVFEICIKNPNDVLVHIFPENVTDAKGSFFNVFTRC